MSSFALSFLNQCALRKPLCNALCNVLCVAALLVVVPEARASGQSAVVSEPCPVRTDTARATATVPSPTASPTAVQTAPPGQSAPVAVVIYAAASASEVRFNAQPEIRVRLCGGLDSIHVLDRKNLPTPVVAGTTYRDVYVAVEIFGRLNADCITAQLTGKPTTLDCASLEVRNATPSRSTRPPASPPDSTRPPRR